MVTLIDNEKPARVRHPEKAHRPNNPILRKPKWIRVKAPGGTVYQETKDIIRDNNIVTICTEGGCPNIGECFSQKHASFMIMGEICTRACAFCNVATGRPLPLDRDDLPDGGAQHFADVIRETRARRASTTIEVLTPDFLRKEGALEIVVAAKPDVYNHNMETVPGNYLTICPGSRYFHSLRLLQRVKEIDPDMFTKSGIMVGLGESRNEVLQLMDDLRSADVDFLTIGQYLQPTKKHAPVKSFITPEEFKAYETTAYSKGFLLVSASPLTRSSHHAGDDFAKLRAARLAKNRH